MPLLGWTDSRHGELNALGPISFGLHRGAGS
jgi:hypothetical protein